MGNIYSIICPGMGPRDVICKNEEDSKCNANNKSSKWSAKVRKKKDRHKRKPSAPLYNGSVDESDGRDSVSELSQSDYSDAVEEIVPQKGGTRVSLFVKGNSYRSLCEIDDLSDVESHVSSASQITANTEPGDNNICDSEQGSAGKGHVGSVDELVAALDKCYDLKSEPIKDSCSGDSVVKSHDLEPREDKCLDVVQEKERRHDLTIEKADSTEADTSVLDDSKAEYDKSVEAEIELQDEIKDVQTDISQLPETQRDSGVPEGPLPQGPSLEFQADKLPSSVVLDEEDVSSMPTQDASLGDVESNWLLSSSSTETCVALSDSPSLASFTATNKTAPTEPVESPEAIDTVFGSKVCPVQNQYRALSEETVTTSGQNSSSPSSSIQDYSSVYGFDPTLTDERNSLHTLESQRGASFEYGHDQDSLFGQESCIDQELGTLGAGSVEDKDSSDVWQETGVKSRSSSVSDKGSVLDNDNDDDREDEEVSDHSLDLDHQSVVSSATEDETFAVPSNRTVYCDAYGAIHYVEESPDSEEPPSVPPSVDAAAQSASQTGAEGEEENSFFGFFKKALFWVKEPGEPEMEKQDKTLDTSDKDKDNTRVGEEGTSNDADNHNNAEKSTPTGFQGTHKPMDSDKQTPLGLKSIKNPLERFWLAARAVTVLGNEEEPDGSLDPEKLEVYRRKVRLHTDSSDASDGDEEKIEALQEEARDKLRSLPFNSSQVCIYECYRFICIPKVSIGYK
ncbi:hypothetical protein LSH36_73g04011 [Paralvinella palmiformis]|uniref:Uncharacterized protein n=1 Tax=Paralvinella palmiformis TaxID=53620 RepID=A0AAD9K4B3_9ANNE|nr:hypothetical protein LSH36_73g04011 [Paralvinella palmiformis]